MPKKFWTIGFFNPRKKEGHPESSRKRKMIIGKAIGEEVVVVRRSASE